MKRCRIEGSFVVAAVFSVSTVMLATGCGIPLPDSSSDDGLRPGETALASGDPSGSIPTDESGNSLADDPSNPWALGWVVTGPAGTMYQTEEALFAAGDSSPNRSNPTLDEEERQFFLYTGFVERAEITVTVVSGGPVVFELVRARMEDPDDFLNTDLQVRDVVERVEVAEGETVVVSGSR